MGLWYNVFNTFQFRIGTLVSVVDDNDNANRKRAKIILTFVLPFHLFYDIFLVLRLCFAEKDEFLVAVIYSTYITISTKSVKNKIVLDMDTLTLA